MGIVSFKVYNFRIYHRIIHTTSSPAPNKSAKKMICSILPSAAAWIGFLGTIATRTSRREGAWALVNSTWLGRSKPTPGATIRLQIVG